MTGVASHSETKSHIFTVLRQRATSYTWTSPHTFAQLDLL